jgi:gluconate 5-dehydrogenase
MARRQNLLDENKAEIEKEYGVKVLAYACDITDTERVKSAVAATIAEFGRVDILINNAGTGAVAPAAEITDEQFKKYQELQAKGPQGRRSSRGRQGGRPRS